MPLQCVSHSDGQAKQNSSLAVEAIPDAELKSSAVQFAFEVVRMDIPITPRQSDEFSKSA